MVMVYETLIRQLPPSSVHSSERWPAVSYTKDLSAW